MANDVFEEFDKNNNTAQADVNSANEGVDAFNDSVDRGKEVKCENCGGNMVFDPETQTLKCEHCGTTIDFEKDRSVNEISIEKAFANAEQWDQAVVVRCENCGSKIVIEGNEVAKECPYCGTSQIKKTDEIAGLKPNAVYPFVVTAENAEAFAKKWAKKRFFAPRKFKRNIEAKNFHGVFEPCFTFDSDTFSTYDGVIGTTHTRVVGSGKNQRVETYVEWRHISGTYSKFFDDVTISASKEMTQKSLNKLMPFRAETIAVYEKKFLAGYQANHYTKEIHGCWDEAKGVMDAKLRQLILNQYSHDQVRYLNVRTTHSKVTYKYVLMPIYRLNYTFKKKLYPVSVNGSTGKVHGKTPVSFLRVFGTILFSLAVVAGIGFLIYYYFIA